MVIVVFLFNTDLRFVHVEHVLDGLNDYLGIKHPHLSETFPISRGVGRPFEMCSMNFLRNAVDSPYESGGYPVCSAVRRICGKRFVNTSCSLCGKCPIVLKFFKV